MEDRPSESLGVFPEVANPTGVAKVSAKRTGMLIGDAEIRETCDGFGLDPDAVIAALDSDRTTQINHAMWHGNRYRPAVEAAIQQLRG